MNTSASASTLSEMLLFHAALGNGYQNPFPEAEGLVYTSALPTHAVGLLNRASRDFIAGHQLRTDSDRKQLAQLEAHNSNGVAQAMGQDDPMKAKDLKRKLSRLPYPTWHEQNVDISTLTDVLTRHAYGALTYVDASSARTMISMQRLTYFSKTISWLDLMGSDSAYTSFLRTNTGGSNIMSATLAEYRFSHIANLDSGLLKTLKGKLRSERWRGASQGKVVLVEGDGGVPRVVNDTVVKALMDRVYLKGDSESGLDKVAVDRVGSCWDGYLNTPIERILSDVQLSNSALKEISMSTASQYTALVFGARAALVEAFIEAVEREPNKDLKSVELHPEHMERALAYARIILLSSSSVESQLRSVDNLTNGPRSYFTEDILRDCEVALSEAIEVAPNRRISRTFVARTVTGVGLAQLDELVKQGRIYELRGSEECAMGNRVKTAYCLPDEAPSIDQQEALAEYEDASQNPDEDDREAITEMVKLRVRAHKIFTEEFLPVIPLSRMTRPQRRILPHILRLYPNELELRGVGQARQEPPHLLSEEDTILDAEGANLWFRSKADGSDYIDWDVAKKINMPKWRRNE